MLRVLFVRCPWPLGSCSPLCPLAVLCCVCLVLSHLAPVHRCARSVCCVCDILVHFAPVPWCARSVCCVCGVLDHLAPAHRCARSVCCVCSVFGHLTPVPWCARSMCCVCLVLGDLAPVYWRAPSVCCVACAVFLATWLLFTCVHAQCVVLCVQCPWPLGSCSSVCTFAELCCMCGVLGYFAPVHRCARSVCSFVCAVSFATWLVSSTTWLPLTGVHARSAVCAVSLAT